MKSIKILNPDCAIKLSKDNAIYLGIDITKDEIRANYETYGPWNIIKSFEALCISNEYDNSTMFTKIASTEIYGKRKLSNIKQSGYCLNGYVSVNGEKRKAYTSDILFDVEGKLINVATINLIKK
jgi:hypothetical protein